MDWNRRDFLKEVGLVAAVAATGGLGAAHAENKSPSIQIKSGEMKMAELFESVSIGSMNLANRFVRSATWEGLADKDGAVTPRLIDMMVELARGEVGLIISGHSFVSPEGQASPWQLAVYDERFLPGLRDMARAVHSAGGKIALQVAHGGCNANPKLTGLELVGPGANDKDGKPTCRAASKDQIDSLVTAFSKAAFRAKEAGFDAVQLHAAHGFLINQFLSPAFNKRTDNYGGSLENRARFILDVVRGARQAVGPEYPVLVKLSSEDFLEGGFTREEAVQVSEMLAKASVNAIEFSGGTVKSPEKLIPPRPGSLDTPEKEVYYREAARLYKQAAPIPLMLVGGIRSFGVAEELIRQGTADFISLSRPLICEPDLVKRWRAGDRRPSECVSDNACFAPGLEGKGIYCVTWEKKRTRSSKS